MANHASAKKRIRQTIKKEHINTVRRSKLRGAIRKLMDALKLKDKDATKAAFVTAESQIMKGVSRGVIRKQTASRKVSRLSAMCKKASS
jgi:small subunit ribosomal protein S20